MINNGAHVLPGGITVTANAVLKGAGIVTGNISVYDFGTLAPGTTNFGTIVNAGDLVLNLGSTNVMKVDASSGLCDSIIGITNLHYAGTLQLTNIAGSFSAGNAFKLFGATKYFGRFGKIVPASPGAGLRWETNGLAIDGMLRVVSTPTPAPAIGSVMTAGGSLVISAASGIPYNPCYLLTCTNFPPAAAEWSPMATNYFDAGGVTSFTNAIPARELRRYFRLQVN